MENSKDNALLPAEFITDPAILHDENNIYADSSRIFQGIPGLEVSRGGNYFIVFYTGTETEGNGNFLLLYKSSDGKSFGKAFMAVIPPAANTRCYDPCLWVDPDGKLNLFWAQSCGWYDGRCGVWRSVCADPDSEVLSFSAPERIANGIMMNKPTVLKNGDWMLPCAVWQCSNSEFNYLPTERFSNLYRSTDGGKSFALWGHCDCHDRGFDEHSVYERADGTLVMLIRCHYGIGVGYSTDGGKTFTKGVDSKLGGPDSRFFVRRLSSGRLILVNHVNFKGRNNLTAMLSEDDGESWKGGLLLDERNDVSYPDGVETPDGFIHIVYDYNRNSDKEILTATFTEKDILAGKLVTPGSELKNVAVKAYGRKE